MPKYFDSHLQLWLANYALHRVFVPIFKVLGLREQLGLKLEARRGPVEVLVITRAERPSAN